MPGLYNGYNLSHLLGVKFSENTKMKWFACNKRKKECRVLRNGMQEV